MQCAIARDTLRDFHSRLVTVMETEFCLKSKLARRLSAQIVRTCCTESALGFANNSRLHGLGRLQCEWSELLRKHRSQVLAEWLARHSVGSVLDLLCGEGHVGERLAERGFPVALSERTNAYNCARDEHPVQFRPFEELEASSNSQAYDTVFLCTVLHHEPNPARLIATAVRLARRRIIVVENCIDEQTPAQIHSLMDSFFCRFLNHFDIACPEQHRSINDWILLLSHYGRITAIDHKKALPGIPLPHDLIAIDLDSALSHVCAIRGTTRQKVVGGAGSR